MPPKAGVHHLNQYWVAHEQRIWVPCKLVSSRGDTATLETDEGETLSMPSSQMSSLHSVQADQISGVDDICSLAVVNEGTILHTVRTRYNKQEIYTNVSRILIAMNPFAALPIYDSKHMEMYKGPDKEDALPPHIFGIGRDAFMGLQRSDRDQAILISGESGAGKTESAKLILSFVADEVREGESGLEDQVLRTNPVLEAFGNAMTVRNNNSSRFGKWLDLRFSGALEVFGCTLTSYLLETTRVCGQNKMERGFHVFFQLLQARAKPEFAHLGLAAPSEYKYLRDGRPKADGIDDASCFEELRESLTALNFDFDTQIEIFTILTAILSLGNGDFVEKGEGSELVDEACVRRCAELLDVSPEEFMQNFLYKKLVVANDVTKAPMRVDQARGAKDAFARVLYGRLFLWLIERMNSTLHIDPAQLNSPKRAGRPHRHRSTHGGRQRLLGILDIAGFECFESNSLEQMLINLSNEHLQQHFNQSFLKAEVEECRLEGVKAPEGLDYSDNADCLALFDSRGGILDLLEEELSVPKGSDKSFISKILREHGKNKRVITPKIATGGFGIRHFAGDVNYEAKGWLEKNAGATTGQDLASMLSKSKLSVLAEIGTSMVAEITSENDGLTGGVRKKVKSASGGFRVSLRALMTKISIADPHYVRCIKPNTKKVPKVFTASMVMEQLRFSGVLAAVQIRQQGYSVRVLKVEFQKQYCKVVESLGIRKTMSGKLATSGSMEVEQLVERLPGSVSSINLTLDPKWFAVGKTKVFMKAEALHVLERARNEVFGKSAIVVQSFVRAWLARRKVKPIKDLSMQLKRCLSSITRCKDTVSKRSTTWAGESLEAQIGGLEAMERVASELDDILHRVEAIPFQNSYVIEAHWVLRRLRLEISAVARLQQLTLSRDIIEIEAAVAQCKSLKVAAELTKQLQKRVRKLKVQVPLVKAMTKVLAMNRIADSTSGSAKDEGEPVELDDIVAEATEAGLSNGSEEWLPDLEGATLFAQVTGQIDSAKQAAEAEEARKAAEAAEAELEKQRQAAEEAARQFEAELEKQQKAAEEAAKAAAAMEAKAADLEVKMEQYREKQATGESALQEAKEEVQVVAARVATLQAELSQAQEAAKVGSEKEAENATKLTYLEAELTNAQQAAKAESDKVAENAAKLSELEAELSMAREAVEVGSGKEAENSARITDLEAELSKAQEVAKAGSEKEAENAAKLSDLEVELSVARETAKVGAEKEAENAARLSDLEAELSNAQQAAKAGAEKEAEVAARLVLLEAELSKAQDAAKAFSEKEAENEAKFLDLEARLELEQQKEAMGAAALSETEKKMEAEIARVAELEATLAEQQKASDQAAQSMADFEKKLKEQQEESHTTNAALVEAQEEAKAAATKLAELEASLVALQEAAEEAKRKSVKIDIRSRAGTVDSLKSKRSICTRRRTVTGMNELEQAVILAGLRRACEDYDLPSLKKLLSKASEEGLHEADHPDSDLVSAYSLLHELQDVDFLISKLDEVREKAEKPRPPLLALRRLENLLLQLRGMPGYEAQCVTGGRVLQQALAARLQTRRHRDSLASSHVGDLAALDEDAEDDKQEEIDIATRVFRNLANYSRLKPSIAWKGHQRGDFPGRKLSLAVSSSGSDGQTASDSETMLTHSQVVIGEALTWTPQGCSQDEYEGGARMNFWNVLVWMQDRPAQECQRLAARKAILTLANDVPWLRQEVYIQIMKQLIRNPSERSAALGWELLHSLCKEAPPDDELAEFIREFIVVGGPELISVDNSALQLWAKSISRACLAMLDNATGQQLTTWQSLADLWTMIWSFTAMPGVKFTRTCIG